MIGSELIGFDGFEGLVEMTLDMTLEMKCWWRPWWLVLDRCGDGCGSVMAGGGGGGESAFRVCGADERD